MKEALTAEQCEFACKTFAKWMHVCEDNNRAPVSDADVGHSSLLRRLLMGGILHENPPPKRHSYPAWELVEKQEIEIHELSDYDELRIDQGGGYEWVDKEKKILRYTRLGIEYEYSEREVTPDPKYLAKGLNPEDHKYVGKFLRRLNDPTTHRADSSGTDCGHSGSPGNN